MACTHTSAQILSVQDNLMELEDDTMPEPVIMMRELLVTPDGSDPVDYILNNVARKANENRKKLNYTATTEFSLYSSNMDLLPQFLSSTQNWLVKTALGFMGMRAIYNYVTAHEELAIGISITQRAKGKETDYTDRQILFSTNDMPENVGKQIMELGEFPLFDVVYGNKKLLDQKKRHKAYDIEFIGSAEEEDGTLYYILKVWRNKGKASQSETTLHITDGTWGVLRQENKSSNVTTYIQCANISSIFLPVKCVQDPNPMSLEELAKIAKEELSKDNEDDKEMAKSERKLIERIEKVAQGERKDAPMMKYSYDVRYN